MLIENLLLWSHVTWVYYYLCSQCLSHLRLWVQIPLRWGVLDVTLCDKVCQWLVADRWFSPSTPVSSTNKTECHDIAEILLRVALNTITLAQTRMSIIVMCTCFRQIISLLSRSPISTSHALNVIIGLITFAGNVFYCPRIPILELFLNDVSSIISRE